MEFQSVRRWSLAFSSSGWRTPIITRECLPCASSASLHLPPTALPSGDPCPTLPATAHLTSLCHARIHPNLRSTVYCNAIAQGGEKEWDFAWEQFRNATLVNEADKLRAALACSNEVWILNR